MSRRPDTKRGTVTKNGYAEKCLKDSYGRWLKNPLRSVHLKPMKDKTTGGIRWGKWEVGFGGPPGTPYEGGFFRARLMFTDRWPENRPIVRFAREYFHPNFYDARCYRFGEGGAEFRDMLRELSDLFFSPVVTEEGANNKEAYKLWKEDRAAFDEKIREQAKQYSIEDGLEKFREDIVPYTCPRYGSSTKPQEPSYYEITGHIPDYSLDYLR